jgi:hypoxanthine-DNA glycosylase
MRSHSFAPIETSDARVLILGSLPGTESLRRQKYYAKPQNVFWRIMGDLFGAGPEILYDARLAVLKARRVAVWDVCAAAFRPGALDSAIVGDSIEPNDFLTLLATHREIGLICFNGAKAAEIYRRRVLPGLPHDAQALRRVVLPSTSPAHAGTPYAEKLRQWREALAPAG